MNLTVVGRGQVRQSGCEREGKVNCNSDVNSVANEPIGLVEGTGCWRG